MSRTSKWNGADRRAFQDGQRLRAHTVPAARWDGPEADEWDYENIEFDLDGPTPVEDLDGDRRWIRGTVVIVGFGGPHTDHHIADTMVGWVRLPKWAVTIDTVE